MRWESEIDKEWYIDKVWGVKREWDERECDRKIERWKDKKREHRKKEKKE